MRRAVTIAVLLLALACPARQAGAQPTPSEQVTPGGIRFQHIALPADTHHALALGWIDGAAYAEPGKELLPGIAARLIMQGSRTVNESARIERLKDLQGSLGLSGGHAYTRALIAAPPAGFAEVVGLFADMIASPALPERKLVLERRNAEISWPQARETSEVVAGQLFLRLMLGDGPRLKAALGDPAGQAAITIPDVEEWRRAVLGRQPATLVSAGPLAPEVVAREIDRMFAGLPAASGTIAAKPEMRQPGRFVVLERPSVQTAMVAGGPSLWVVDADAVLGRLAVRVLGSGFDSRLTKAVREGLGATYGIRASLQQLHPQAFVLNIASQVDNTRALDALHAVRREYARFQEAGVTAGEIEPLKTRIVSEVREQYRRSTGAAQGLRDTLLSGLPALYPATFPERVKGITAEAVNAGIRQRMPAPPLTVVVVAPSAAGLGADCVITSPDDIAKCE